MGKIKIPPGITVEEYRRKQRCGYSSIEQSEIVESLPKYADSCMPFIPILDACWIMASPKGQDEFYDVGENYGTFRFCYDPETWWRIIWDGSFSGSTELFYATRESVEIGIVWPMNVPRGEEVAGRV